MLVLFYYEDKASDLQEALAGLTKTVEESVNDIWSGDQDSTSSMVSSKTLYKPRSLHHNLLNGKLESIFVNDLKRSIFFIFLSQMIGPESTANTIALAMQQGEEQEYKQLLKVSYFNTSYLCS